MLVVVSRSKIKTRLETVCGEWESASPPGSNVTYVCCCTSQSTLLLFSRTKINTRLETAYGEWVERIPTYVCFDTS